jgi:hypothetical protein
MLAARSTPNPAETLFFPSLSSVPPFKTIIPSRKSMDKVTNSEAARLALVLKPQVAGWHAE